MDRLYKYSGLPGNIPIFMQVYLRGYSTLSSSLLSAAAFAKTTRLLAFCCDDFLQ
jgi:hypothetical protein